MTEKRNQETRDSLSAESEIVTKAIIKAGGSSTNKPNVQPILAREPNTEKITPETEIE